MQIMNSSCSTRMVENFASEDARLTPILRLGAGACAGIIAISATYPMDMVRGCQVDDYGHDPKDGFRMWVSTSLSESLKDRLIKSKPFGLVNNSSELTVTTRLACAAAAGTVGQTVAYPLDDIRRMQMMAWNHAASVLTGVGRGKVPLEYSGMVDALGKLFGMKDLVHYTRVWYPIL
ncbi:unnamed protein product [Lupinus luteus]|uniref:Uncharacterized protein n=1 Tax=Lupinus luteus TaxID=3873 RepID=A0AAV1X9U6_LUPLU